MFDKESKKKQKEKRERNNKRSISVNTTHMDLKTKTVYDELKLTELLYSEIETLRSEKSILTETV